MNTRTALLVGIVAVIVVAIVVSQTSRPSVPTPRASSIAVSTSTITASTTEYTVNAAYPQFGIPVIDARIKTQVQKGISDLESQADQDKPAENDFPQYAFTSIFDDVYIGSDIISVRLVLSQYTGGAHEMPAIFGENFDRATGAQLTLDQALALTGRTLDQVAAEAKKQLAQDPATSPTGMWASGSDPTRDNYSTFRITKDAVIFIFQPYQVAPYAAGAPEVTIPRST